MEPMDEPLETEIHLKDYLRVVVKRKWVVLAVFVAVVTTVAIATFRQRPLYQATAQLQIEKENPNILSIKEVMELDASNADYYQTQYRILQSRSLAQAVIDRLGLATHPEFAATGAAFGFKMLKKDNVAAAFGGDGATAHGDFHEGQLTVRDTADG